MCSSGEVRGLLKLRRAIQNLEDWIMYLFDNGAFAGLSRPQEKNLEVPCVRQGRLLQLLVDGFRLASFKRQTIHKLL